MIDEFEGALLDCSWGGQALDILGTSDNLARAISRSRYPNVDGAVLRDLGAEERETACTVVFLPPDCVPRFKRFLALYGAGKAQRFVHPLTGSYLAHAVNLRPKVNGSDRDYIEVDVDFVETKDEPTFASVSTAVNDTASVTAAIAGLETDLATLGATSDVPAAATAQLTSWESADGSSSLTARQINLEVGTLANQIQDDIDRLDLASDVDNYPLMRSLTRLHNTLRELASRYMATAPKLTEHTVTVAEPLLAICQSLYGGAAAADAFERLVSLNDVPNPGLVEAGTVLVVEVPSGA